MLTVSLNGVEFFAYHGFYQEEQLIGGRFIVDLSVAFKPVDELSADDITHTVNYETLHSICRSEMSETRKLIETVAQAIINQVTTQYPFVEQVDVLLKKMHPPLSGPVNHSAVRITYNKGDN
ncbi:dihydroneopterin aldolase [Mucilaginibacter sp. JRF]|uniref:dihydroneopterin aldolase n=1 Tax=Mucilaginibacter sp. JRF TaxID=2780088 RepID=UPI00188290E2|nr:dihydroneopterin aldolase [Mucilaginibacter sp. JRF]MBE9583635.1 dihydroneopterin aldolase [Mucilaginibacter sp. JRF]